MFMYAVTDFTHFGIQNFLNHYQLAGFLLGDEAYQLKQLLLTPLRDVAASAEVVIINASCLLRTRKAEHTFG